MADEKNTIPELTLTPSAAQEAVPELTLDPAAQEQPAQEPEKPEVTPVQMDENLLSDAEKRRWWNFPRRSI